MSTVRRRVLRHGPVSTVSDIHKAARYRRQREKLEKDRAALKRWLTRLKRATNTVTNLHQRISRLEVALHGCN
jgi:predicted RNase H-like nuclease (RuvC/YqgF family)